MRALSSEVLQIFAEMITLFVIVAAGYAGKRLGMMNEDFDARLSKVILNLSLPGMIIGSVLTAEQLPSLQDILLTLLFSCLSFAVVIAIALAVTFAMRISDSLIYATIFNLPFNFLVFTVGAWFLTQDNASDGSKIDVSWRLFISPVIISCLVAIVLALCGVHGIPVVGAAFNSLGSLTTPAALLIIGSSLANLPAGELIGGFRLWMASLFRLIIIPLVVWGIFHFFLENPLLLGVIVVISGMPVATNGTMLCYQYGGNSHDMAQGTFVTTIASLVSIPLLVMFLSAVA